MKRAKIQCMFKAPFLCTTINSPSEVDLWRRCSGCFSFGISFIALVCAIGVALMLASPRVVAAPRWYVASCAVIGIVSQGLARPCSVDLSVSPQTESEPVVSLQMDAKNWGFRPRFVRERSTGLPLLMLNTWCSQVWVR